MRVGASTRREAENTAATDRSGSAEHRFDSPALILAIGAVLALGVVLRFVCASDLWADEVLSVNISKLPLGRISTALRHDGAPPLYYFLLHGWMRVFGTGTTSVRALSGGIGVLTLWPTWYIGRRLDERRVRLGLARAGSRTVAWSALLLLALSPFAIRYSTEARMYALVMLEVTVGYLALARALERPVVLRLAIVVLISAAMLYTHYWAFSLLGVVGAGLVVIAVRSDRERRPAAALVAAALAIGGVLFLPWFSAFRFQLAHTGTPWGAPVSPFGSWATAFKSFGGNAHLAGWALVVLIALGVFARAIDARHIEFDLGTRRGVRLEAGVAFGALAVGLVIGRLSGTTFEGRYASVVFPLFLVIGAFGIAIFSNARLRVAVLAGVLVLGAWGGVSNAARNRTQAYQLAPIIRDHGAAGDVVLFCPDAIGTDVVGRLRLDLRVISFPSFTSPVRIDWVDYQRRVDAVRPSTFVDRVLRLAGTHTVWFVDTNNGTAADQKCSKIADLLTLHRPGRVHELEPDPYFFEHQGLYRYPPN